MASRTGAGGADENHADLLRRLLLAASYLPALQGLYPALEVGNDALQALDFIVEVAHLVRYRLRARAREKQIGLELGPQETEEEVGVGAEAQLTKGRLESAGCG